MSDDPSSKQPLPFLTRVVDIFLRGDVAIMLTLVVLALGAVSLVVTPREEEPQIVVPLADVFVQAPGLSAEEIENQVTNRLEKLLFQVDGVEYVYSMSQPGQAVVTVRFHVGEDREDSLVKIYNKIHSAIDSIPPDVTSWVVKPIEIDDVPIVNITLWSDDIGTLDDHGLRRIAEELQQELQAIPNTNRVEIHSGRPRQINVVLDTKKLAAHGTSPQQVESALRAGNVRIRSGQFSQLNEVARVEVDGFFRSAGELADLVINVNAGRPIYLKNVARIEDGPAEASSYSWMGFGSASREQFPEGALFPAVHLSVAKRKGANAVTVSQAVQEKIEALKATHFPNSVHATVTRDYGETANDKVNELVEALVVAVLTVVGLIGFVMGWRPAIVVALAIPICYSATLFINHMVGYSINRVTLFALILSLGLLVDDPITDVENIARYFSMRILPARQSVLRAVQEVRPALLLSTLAIIASFAPLAFITGMMGPYMAPMALNVPLTVAVSTVIAFVITPWLAMVALRHDEGHGEGGPQLEHLWIYRTSKFLIGPLLVGRWRAVLILLGIGCMFIAACILPVFRLVPVKMLPYDNKNEFQVMIDMPESSTLERTDSVARQVGEYLSRLSEVENYQVFSGIASPMDFNGLVRHYYLRRGENVADVRVNLVAKEKRLQQSHEIILRIRKDLDDLGRSVGAILKVVEVPPGPPVLATITAEVYGPVEGSYEQLIEAAGVVEHRLREEPGVVDVDLSSEEPVVRYKFEADKAKAALSGISTEAIARTIEIVMSGSKASILHLDGEVDPLWIELRLPLSERSALDDLREIYVQGQTGESAQLGSLGEFVSSREEPTIYHKNLRRVMFVYGEVAGRPPADVILDVESDRLDEVPVGSGSVASSEGMVDLGSRNWLRLGGGVPWYAGAGIDVVWSGEGEWKITLDVFRDLGLAFGAALIAIFVILVFQTGSRMLPVLIMLAIPLTLIGVMPGFWLLNAVFTKPIGGYENPVFFTATAMIGMIALSGIVVRNSVVLIDFIHLALSEGFGLREAIIRSVAIRTRPILLTAGTTLLGNWVITLDPVFSGLAWAIIFGITTSTLFTLVVIPASYWFLYGKEASA